MHIPKLTLFGRSILLITCEIAANAICWIVAGILFGRNSDTHSLLSLSLLAWTLGLRHALDADHISAIDNATRGLINIGQMPVTCGLFFSLGHSTIVVVVNVAIAISADVYNKLHGVGEVGGIVGAALSGSFLFIVGLANSVILWKIIRRRQAEKHREKYKDDEKVVEDLHHNPKSETMLMMRILGPIITFVNRPWKMYPVGILFGFGFDTASSIALIAVSALAKRGSDGSPMPSGYVVILPLLFTAGMTLVDAADSILMLYSYTGFNDRSLVIFAKSAASDSGRGSKLTSDDVPTRLITERVEAGSINTSTRHPEKGEGTRIQDQDLIPAEEGELCLRKVLSKTQAVVSSDEEGSATPVDRDTRVKMNVMSGLSIVLTLMSILVAFSISLIAIMGLIGEQCGPCAAAAAAEDGHGGGLAGRWWRGWAKANDQSGFIGVAIVGGFLLVVMGWYGSQWAANKMKATFVPRSCDADQ